MPTLLKIARQHLAFIAFAGVFLSALNACRPKKEAAPDTAAPDVTHVATLHKNTLTLIQSNFTSSQTHSPIHWQTWNKDLFTQAKSERKTVFAFIGSSSDANSLNILNALNQSTPFCNQLNDHHVNVLIDSDIHPDLELYSSLLCLDSRFPVSSPLFIWFSYEGYPISWIPVGAGTEQHVIERLSRMSNTVHRLWRDDPDYVLKNSKEDFARRALNPFISPLEKESPGITTRAIRQAASLVDPTSGHIDAIGKLTPARYIDLLVKASQNPNFSNPQRSHYLQMASLATETVILKGLLDPLDGGIYSAPQKTTSALPQFVKTLRAQSFSIKALYSLYLVTHDTRHLQAANSILAYTEKHLALPDGGYRTSITYANNSAKNNPCVWTLEEIEATLTQEELRICTLAFGLKGLGNIPLVDDPDRAYFRKNVLVWKLSLAELAAKTSLATATLNQHLKSITKQLAKLRSEKSPAPFQEDLSTASSTALYSSACTTAYRVTGDPQHLKRATNILTTLRKQFIDSSGTLHRARFAGTLNEHPATGADYAMVCQAALDLHEATLDPKWLEFARDIHQRMTTTLSDPSDHSLMEYDGTGYPMSYKTQQVFTIPTLDNDNTWAVAYSNNKRLSLRMTNDQLNAQRARLRSTLLRVAPNAPISSIDFLTAEAHLSAKTIYIKAPASPELLQHALRSPYQIVSVTSQGNYPELAKVLTNLPAGSAVVTLQGKIIGSASNASELDTLLK